MKRRDLFLFLSFAALFMLFAIFQNFSFPAKQLRQLSEKQFFQEQIKKYVPTYSFNDYIGEFIEVPYGYMEEVGRKIASKDAPIIFDQKKFIKDEINALPVYKDIKDFIEIDSDSSVIESGSSCSLSPSESQHSCITKSSDKNKKTGSVKLKTNPLRQTASVSIPGNIESQMTYIGERKSINMQFKKEIGKDSGVKLEIDSENKSGSFKYDVRW